MDAARVEVCPPRFPNGIRAVQATDPYARSTNFDWSWLVGWQQRIESLGIDFVGAVGGLVAFGGVEQVLEVEPGQVGLFGLLGDNERAAAHHGCPNAARCPG